VSNKGRQIELKRLLDNGYLTQEDYDFEIEKLEKSISKKFIDSIKDISKNLRMII